MELGRRITTRLPPAVIRGFSAVHRAALQRFDGRFPDRFRWQPVARATDLAGGRAVAFALDDLHGDEWVVWRDAAGRLCAQPRRCPHLAWDLAEAVVVGTELVCPGHGWSFGADGRAVKRNQRGRADPKGTVVTLAVRERDGVVEVSPERGTGGVDR
jgi:phenylpropionate dioxygenase-like ring-hydroxylating dioxygenase large terminal subunit